MEIGIFICGFVFGAGVCSLACIIKADMVCRSCKNDIQI